MWVIAGKCQLTSLNKYTSNLSVFRRQSINNVTSTIRIIIADDHTLLRQSLIAMLSTQPEFEVIGEAGTGQTAFELVQSYQPDVLLLDLFMPEHDGFDVLRMLERVGNPVGTLILTASENEMDYVQAVRLGAKGLVLKEEPPDKLFEAIRAVARGELAFSDDIARQVVHSISDVRKKASHGMERLSERERSIALLVARGMRNREIGTQLNISENTVKRHLKSIFSKTGARDRLELAVITLAGIGKAA